jgi:predicted CXXCH cytochrome family protein
VRGTDIQFADVVGFGRLIAADEAGTFARLETLSRGLIAPTAAEYGDRVVALTGDDILAAHDLVPWPRPYRTGISRPGHTPAAKLCGHAIALNPNYALVHAGLAFVRADEREGGRADNANARLAMPWRRLDRSWRSMISDVFAWLQAKRGCSPNHRQAAMMSKLLFAVPLAVLPVLASVPAGAQGLSGSAHDLSQFGWSGGDLCIVCHTPHAEDAASGTLWNRETPQGPYIMYSSATIGMDIAESPQGVSLACLSCHDGTIAVDAFGGNPGGAMWIGTGPALVGTDLSTVHPVSVTYDTAKDPDFNDSASVVAAGLVLYGKNKDQVECGSCHDPHDPSNQPFLRMSNAGSALCLTCHDK